MTRLLLEVQNLSTIFKTDEGIIRAVNDVSFGINKNESLGIVGESGCGKSVTNLSLMGLIPSAPGKIIKGKVFYKGRECLGGGIIA